ncbi:hypothetical protein TNCT_253111 [Trichonephila clavata]|uniref:Uncharacterized protein n=1 Tax=Trichonephila clavata TaxID=2740835 RepID=A0A8X6LTL1_TRICU|nr:hypothetical protein TNCT_253111 [Trichonephila clavata]
MRSVCRKSSASTTVAPPIIAELPRKSCNVLSRAWKAFLGLMVASSQTISLQVLRTCPCPVPLDRHMEHYFWLVEARVWLEWNESCLRTFLM